MKKHPSKDQRLAVKIASASCNQTAGDWPRNIRNICRAIDMAADDGADILGLEELGLCGYERGDDFYYSDNDKTFDLLKVIAEYAFKRAPNLIVSVGHPWFFADKDIPSAPERRKNPIFNRINNNFNVMSLIAGGGVVSMSAKRYLFNYERGYEKRHFEEWSETLADSYKNRHGKGRDGTILIALPDKSVIPFGAPVVAVGSLKQKINVHHLICEEYWVGSAYDGTGSAKDYDRDNPLAQKARHFDIALAINANASPPAPLKYDRHKELCKLATRHCQAIVHTDGLGSSGSTFAQFGSRIMAQGGKIVSEGVRCSFRDVAYTSQILRLKPSRDKGRKPHALIVHAFKDKHSAARQDGPAAWEKSPRREFEEEMRNELLWLFDYLRKNRISGVAQALSGGADSAYNAAKVRLMVELGVAELGVEGFMEALGPVSYKNDVLDVLQDKGSKAAVAEIMSHMLTCVYMGTDNSSEETLRAAQTLVEGGKTEKGESFKGIGGKFYYRNVQRLIELYAEIFSGVNPSGMSDEREAALRNELASILKTRPEDTTKERLSADIAELKKRFGEITHDVLSVANPAHQLPYENIQARFRQVLIMLFANVENKIAISNPNLDEGRNSYATWGGDLHGGMISGNAHKSKDRELEHMRLLHDFGIEGIEPVKGFYWPLRNRPSAELQPRSKEGKVTQFDEDQLGRSFKQMDVISHYMLYDRPVAQAERKNSPLEVFQKCRRHEAFLKDDIETLHDRIILSYQKWGHAQFKVHGSPIAATYGRNIDHQSSLRTPNTSANQRPEQAQMTLFCLAEMAKRDGIPFGKLFGGARLNDLMRRVLIDEAFINDLFTKMGTPGATDGRKTKIRTLYEKLVSDISIN